MELNPTSPEISVILFSVSSSRSHALLIRKPLPYEQLIYRTNIGLEVDTYWAFVGMKNPIALLERIKDRINFIHIKDGFEDGKGMPLGNGVAPVKDVYAWAKGNGKLMVVESETCTPDGLTEVKICIDCLHSLEK